MKILIFGRGVIGTQYGWALEQAGHSVTFYVRQGKKAVYGPNLSLDLMDARQGRVKSIKTIWKINMIESFDETHDFDIILFSLNPDQIKAAADFIRPRLGKASLLFFGNVWQDPRQLLKELPQEQVVYGFPMAGGGLVDNHLYCGFQKHIHLGTFKSALNPRYIQVQSLFQSAGFKAKVNQDMEKWYKNHFIFNTAMEVEVLKAGSFKKVLNSPQAINAIPLNVKEMIPVLDASGVMLDGLTKAIQLMPSGIMGFILRKLVFKPGSMSSFLVIHNQYKVGFAVKEIIKAGETYGIHLPRLNASVCRAKDNSHGSRH